MSHFAEIDENNIVLRVIVAEQDFIDTMPGRWVQTSYNSQNGVHYGQDGLPSGRPAFRWTFAGVGMYYHEEIDQFVPMPVDRDLSKQRFNTTDRAWEPIE